MRFTIITGVSGAGRSSALKALEDLGFFCADNIPPVLIPAFAKTCIESSNPPENVAVVADMRMGAMFDSIYDAIETLKTMDLTLDILFLDASDKVLLSRFTQTRRRHPVSGSGNVLPGILVEREKLQRIKDMANNIIDTSTYTARKLTSVLSARYSQVSDQRLLISVISFGYKRGVPMDADFVFDVRFLPNPFYIKRLQQYSGLTKGVKDYVLGFAESEFFLDKTIELIDKLAPAYVSQDKKQLVLAIGCTGGMHRSVVIAEEIFSRLQKLGHRVTIEHRDVELEQDAVKKL